MLFFLWHGAQLLLNWEAHKLRSETSPCKSTAQTDQGRDCSLHFPEENMNRANCLQLQKGLWLSQVFIPDPALPCVIFPPHSPSPCRQPLSSDPAAGALRALAAHAAHSSPRAPREPWHQPLGPGATGSSKLGTRRFPFYLLLPSPKSYGTCLGLILRCNICGSLKWCNFVCVQVACSAGRGARREYTDVLWSFCAFISLPSVFTWATDMLKLLEANGSVYDLWRKPPT